MSNNASDAANLQLLQGIFPGVEMDIITAVYDTNSKSVDLTVNDLMEITGGVGAVGIAGTKNPKNASGGGGGDNHHQEKEKNHQSGGSHGHHQHHHHHHHGHHHHHSSNTSDASPSRPTPKTKEEQLAMDEQYALELQARETKRQNARETSRFIGEQLGISGDGPEKSDMEIIKEAYKKSVAGVKGAFKSITKKLTGDHVPRRQQNATGATDYNNLPNNDFGRFLNDEDEGGEQHGNASGDMESPFTPSAPPSDFQNGGYNNRNNSNMAAAGRHDAQIRADEEYARNLQYQ